MKISIVIPTFNERKNIIPLVKRVLTIFNTYRYSFEIIVVDDNSPDQTGLIARREFCDAPSVKVFIRKGKRELGSAIGFGIKKAKGEIIVGIDGDGSHPAEKIPALLAKLKPKTLVVASRFIKDGGMGDRMRFITSYLFNLFLKHIFRFPILDNTSGFYAIYKADLDKLSMKKIYRGYGDYHLRLVYAAKRKSFNLVEVPFYMSKRRFGKSKSRLFSMFINYTLEAFRLVVCE